MADYTKSGGMSTAKARRKDNAKRNNAHGLATLGRTKRQRNQTAAEPAAAGPALADLVPQARAVKATEATYVMVEHRRRDTGAVSQALDLNAPDAPPERILPEEGEDGPVFAFAVQCVTHQSEPVCYATASQARKEVKSSHKWCPGCRGDQARTPAAREKATAKQYKAAAKDTSRNRSHGGKT
jgi:hypothetical protein